MATPMHALFDLMAPPAQPRNLGDIPWEAAEAALGVSFSEQYKLFFAVYGDGSIDGELGFFSYRSAGKAKKFLSDSTVVAPDDVTPFPMYPAGEKSLLPLGYDGYGFTVYCVVERGRMLEDEFWAGNRREGDWVRFGGPFLDSTVVRLSWNPTRTLSLQGSWGHFNEPEQLEPGVDQKRWSASVLYTDEVAPGWQLATALAWGRKSIDHHGEWWNDDAFAAEASLRHGGWTMFSRGEMTENRELVPDDHHGEAHTVRKLSLGVVRDFGLARNVAIGLGGLFSVNFVPSELAPLYGSRRLAGAMVFTRLKIE